MNLHNIKTDEALTSLITTEGGLTGEDAAGRLIEYGPNEITGVRKKPLYLKVLAQFTHFLAVLLWTAAALCVISGVLHPGEGMLSLAAAIVLVIFINAAFTLIQEYRAERAVEALKKLLPFNVKVMRGGKLCEVRASGIAPGDIVVLAEGDKVPADARVIESSRLMVNNAPLTGESEPLPRNDAPFGGEFMESPNIVFAGTLVSGGSGKAAVFATGMSTEFGKIAHLTGAVEPGLTPLQKEIAKATRIVAVIAAITGVSFFAVGLAVGQSFWRSFLFAIGIIIANVPEGLLPTVTLSLAMGSQRMARKNALIKTLSSVETLGSVTVICTDKTGTLTENRMAVREIWSPSGGNGAANPPDREMLMLIAGLCNNASFEDGRYRGDPTEAALLKSARESYPAVKSRRIAEIPFDSDRKRMTTIDEVEGRTLALTKGALETVLPTCGGVLARGEAGPLDEKAKAAITGTYARMAGKGLRVIAFAFKTMDGTSDPRRAADSMVESGLVFAGLIGLEDPPRPGVSDAVIKCRDAGIKVVMMTGDSSGTATAIARQVGLAGEDPLVIEGAVLAGMDDGALRDALTKDELIFSRMTPRQKMRVVSVLKDEGERVAVTGDGVNDAPALKKADIGIAMGLAGTDVAREAADMVLLDDNFATIVAAVEEGRAVYGNIRKFITYIFAHLTPEAVPYMMFALFNIPLPLTVMQILAIDLGTETLPALALGVEPPERDTMKYPSGRDKPLIDRALLFRGYVFLGLISAAGVLTAYFYVLYTGGWRWGASLPMDSPLARQAATASFLGIVIMQVGNVFACRSYRVSVFSLGFFTNRLVLAGVAVEIALAYIIIYTGIGNEVFGTAPVGLDTWLVALPFSATLLLADEVRKWFARRPLQHPL